MVIDYILANGQQPNPLYYQGFDRVVCFPCVMNNLKGIRLIIENHPKQWQKVKDAEKLVSGFFPPDKIPKRFSSNGKYPTTEDIEKYISNRNATIDMFDDGGQPGCMSMYGLCE